MTLKRTALFLSIALLALALAACAAPAASSQASPYPTDPALAFTPPPLVDMSQVPTLDPSLANLSAEGYVFEQTGYELIAEQVGRAEYAGYICLIGSGVGCDCSTALDQYVTFEFVDDNTLIMKVENEYFTTQWSMERVGPNQWTVTIPIYKEEDGAFAGNQFRLLTFTETGFIFTEGLDLYGQITTCQDVAFDRTGN